MDFKLAVDAINADRYLAPGPEDTAVPREEKPTKKAGKTAMIDIVPTAEAAPATPDTAAATGSQNEGLRSLNARGQLTVGKLTIGKLKTSNLDVSMNAKDGFILIQPASADLYDGKYKGSVAIDGQTDVMKLTLDEDFQGVQAGKLLEDLQGKSRISGKANVNLKLTTAGREASAFRQNLGGQVKLLFTNGAVKGINIGKLIRMAKQGVILPVEPESETDFAELKGTLNIVKGVINNDDFDAKSPLFRFAGRGKVDLVQNQIDYVLDTTVTPTAEGQGGADLQDLQGFTIPIKITGPTNKPRFMPDLAAIAKQRAQKELEKQKGKLLDKVPGGGGLKNLLKF
jgi:AsmA protein